MAEPPVHNLTAYNNTVNIQNVFMCTSHFLLVKVWIWCSCICFFLGIPTCLVVLRELFRRRRQGTCNDFFMLNLYFADLTFTVTLPLAICNVMFIKSSDVFNFISFIHSLPICGRPLFMACICGDCYIAVLHPIMYKISKNAGLIRKAVTLMAWCITLSFGSLLCAVQSTFTNSLISAPLTIALPVITFCDISILYTLRKPDPSGNKIMHQQKKQALYTIFSSLAMTFISYLPPAIIFLLAEALPISRERFFCYFSFVGLSFYNFGCVTMPLLHLQGVGKMDNLKSWLRKKVIK